MKADLEYKMGAVISLANNSTYYHVPNTFQRLKENWAKLVDIESLDQMLDKIPEFSVLRDSNTWDSNIIHMLANMWMMLLSHVLLSRKTENSGILSNIWSRLSISTSLAQFSFSRWKVLGTW